MADGRRGRALDFEARHASDDPRFFRVSDGRTSPALAALVQPNMSPCVERLAAVIALDTRLVVDRTPFEGIRRVPPGAYATWIGDRFVRSAAAAALPPIDAEGEALPKLLREALERAVARAMGDAKCVAVLVGGGVDSSVLLALAHAEAKRRGHIEVVPVALDAGGENDDRPYLRELTRHLGLAPTMVDLRDAGPLARRALVMDAAPYPWPSGTYDLALCEAAKRAGAEVVLSGSEGDFVFDGDPTLLAQRARAGHVVEAFARAHAMVTPWSMSTRQRMTSFVLWPLVAERVPSALRAVRRRRRIARLYPFAGPRLHEHLRALVDSDERAPSDVASRAAAFATMPRFAEIAQHRVQFARETGLVFREPLIDPELLDFVARIDPLALMMGNRTRGLLREAVRDLVPDRVRLRADKWAHEPAMLAAVEAAGGFSAFADLAEPREAEKLGLVDARRFRAFFDDLGRNPLHGDWSTTWAVLAVEEFLRKQR